MWVTKAGDISEGAFRAARVPLSAVNTFDYELHKMYEWYWLTVQSLEVHIHNNPMEKRGMHA